ncbi:NAD-dependent epimerase/dehydratase family protein [Amnibacterium kyonggiense]
MVHWLRHPPATPLSLDNPSCVECAMSTISPVHRPSLPAWTADRSAAPGSAIVFGGSGFIGGRMLRLLHARGVERLACADVVPPKDLGFDVDFHQVDVREPIDLPGSWDVAYNFSAVHRTPGHPDQEYFETNVAGAINVTNFCRDRGIETIVFTSSIAVYGPKEDLLTEASEPQPTSAYGRSKLLAEDIHRTWFADDPRRRLVIVRPAVIFGEGENGNFDRLRGALASRRFAYPGRTDTIKACGYVEELVRSLEWVRNGDEQQVTFNFAYPERATIEQIATTIAANDGTRLPLGRIPLMPMLAAASMFEVLGKVGVRTGINRARIQKLVRSTNVYPGYLVEQGYPFGTDVESGIAAWLRERSAVEVAAPVG